MIRRNHIETVTRIDRHQLRQQVRDPGSSQKHQNYLYRKTPDVVVDENFRAASSNKKYHQYKDWKEQHRKKPEIEQFKSIKQPTEPLNEITSTQHQATHRIRQDYQKELQTMLNRQYTSQAEYEPRKRWASSSTSPAPFNYLRSNPRDSSQSELPSYEDSFTSTWFERTTPEPLWKRNNTNSTHKNSSHHQKSYQVDSIRDKPSTSSKDFSPQFRAKHLKTQNNFLPFSSTTGLSYNRAQLQQFDSSLNGAYDNDRTIGRAPTDYLKTLAVAEKRQRIVERPEERSLQVEEPMRGDQKVAEKLKLISSFNDQINDRIKNIISCFEELRTKL